MGDRPPRSPLLFRRWRFPGARPGLAAGSTTNAQTGKPYDPVEGGYGIGTHEGTVARAERGSSGRRLAHEKAAQERLSRRAPELRTSGYYVGTWRSGGGIDYDPSEIEPNLDTAMNKARARKQKAIWDFKNSREITVG
jgi:hypothetical protein